MVYSANAESKDYTIVTFEKIQLSDQFHSEGAGVGDFNKDGHKDVVVGSQWYAGPDFKNKTAFRPVAVFEPKATLILSATTVMTSMATAGTIFWS
jgi:hypothetical protein